MYIATLPCEISVFKNCHARGVHEANCHVKLSSSKQCSRKRVQQLKNVKSHVFLNLKKTLKNAGLPLTYSFTGRSISQPLILNYRIRNSVPVPVRHQHHTPCSEMWTQETNMQLTCSSVIVKRL